MCVWETLKPKRLADQCVRSSGLKGWTRRSRQAHAARLLRRAASRWRTTRGRACTGTHARARISRPRWQASMHLHSSRPLVTQRALAGRQEQEGEWVGVRGRGWGRRTGRGCGGVRVYRVTRRQRRASCADSAGPASAPTAYRFLAATAASRRPRGWWDAAQRPALDPDPRQDPQDLGPCSSQAKISARRRI